VTNFKEVYSLQNIEWKSQAYLYHLYQSYHNLAEVTIFVQGEVYNLGGSAPLHTAIKSLGIKDRALRLGVGDMSALGGRKRRFVDWNGIPHEKC
jgi:hypothetical protein